MTPAHAQPVMEARGLVKRYGQVTALDGADFELLPGEVLAVIGDNGAGKSTLIKALTGAIVPDSGEIKLDGQVVHFRTPIDARRHGIADEKSACLLLGRLRLQHGVCSRGQRRAGHDPHRLSGFHSTRKRSAGQ